MTMPQAMGNPSQENERVVVVGVGASAGGVEALEKLFSVMPDRMGMAFVVVQHLSSDFESLMHQILGRRTMMPVFSITDGMEVRANHVYVLPSGSDVRFENDCLRLFDRVQARGANNPIDKFFESLAADNGSNSIGIVLSGTGSDGSIGIRKIHDAGGFVIVQSEQSAKFNGMPRSAINTGIADSIASVDEIPNVLIRFSQIFQYNGDLASNEMLSSAMTEENRIINLLRESFDIDFDDYKTAMFSRRIERRILLTDEPNVKAYVKTLESNPNELKNLYSDLLIGVTEFFRDPDAFDELQRRILPELVESISDEDELRIWVAPCATGEEAYSIAMLLHELKTEMNRSFDIKIFATDVNQDCVDFASNGCYPEESLANVNKQRVATYFKKIKNGYRVSRELRKIVVFAKHNVLVDAPFTKIDLVSCRNLLIYMKTAAKNKALSLFNFSLRDGRFLFLGPSESASELSAEFKELDPKWKFYRKVAPIRLSSVRISENSPRMRKGHSSEHGTVDPPNRLNRVYDNLLTEFMPPSILVDKNHEIIHVFGAATQFLEFREGRPTKNLLQLLPPTFRTTVKNGLKRVMIESKPVAYAGVRSEDSEDQIFRITVLPIDDDRKNETFLIKIESSLVPEASDSFHEDDDDAGNSKKLRLLKEELDSTRESLHASILDLKSANEEMQTTNEELIAANEELQSTNEELHSVNEELYTVNSEHQRKITELTEMTDDMDNLLDSIRVDTVFLDRDLRVRKFTFGIANTFRLLPQDIGRHFDTFNHELDHENIVGLAQQVLDTEVAHEEEVMDHQQNWYLMRILPYNSRGKIDGVLLTLVDITKIKEAEQMLAELSEIVQSSDDAIFRIDLNGDVRTWNRGAENLFCYDATAMIGKNIATLDPLNQSQNFLPGMLNNASSRETFDHLELRATRQDGKEIDVQLTMSPIIGSSGDVVGASVVMRDITELKQSEIQSRQEVRRRDQFMAMLSHELRNPVAAIMSALAVLKKSPPGSEKGTEARDIIFRHSRQLAKLLDDLLDVSQIAHDKVSFVLKPIDIVETAKEVIECIEGRVAKKNQELTLSIPQEPVHILADESRIIQAQVNLLVNACKYTPKNGQITYSIHTEDDHAIVEVSDNGEGIDEDLMSRIFEVFVQADQPLDRNRGGMGLGLPLVRMIADAHRGTISAYSGGRGAGSKFALRIPVTQLREPKSENQPAVSVPSDRNRVLLVEDNDGARAMLAEYLNLEGFLVKVAPNGRDGVQLFDQFKPNICVVDIGLPDLNGYEVAKEIRSDSVQPDLLIALTGYGQENDQIKVKAAGFDIHLIKPIDPEQLVQTISQQLQSLASTNKIQA